MVCVTIHACSFFLALSDVVGPSDQAFFNIPRSPQRQVWIVLQRLVLTKSKKSDEVFLT